MEGNITLGLLLIATNKYKQFVPQFLESADKHFFKGHELEVYLFTDEFTGFDEKGGLGNISDRMTVRLYGIEPYKFPHATLLRYKIFHSYRKIIDCDYIFYADVDTQFVDDVGKEILPTPEMEQLVAVRHCGFYGQGGGSWETRPESTSYVPEEKRIYYYAGGFQGGRTDVYLNYAKQLAENIKADGAKNIIPVWHDESAWNCLLSGLDSFRELTPDYCMVEQEHLRNEGKVGSFPPKLVALAKNHEELRK